MVTMEREISQISINFQLPHQNGCKNDLTKIRQHQKPNKNRNDPGSTKSICNINVKTHILREIIVEKSKKQMFTWSLTPKMIQQLT